MVSRRWSKRAAIALGTTELLARRTLWPPISTPHTSSTFSNSEASSLVKPGMIDAVHGVGFPPLRELVEKVRDFEIPVYV